MNMLLVLCAFVAFGVVDAARWSHSAYLSPDYRLLWSLGPGPQDITFEIQVRTLGSVGFGFSRDGRMAGADMVVGWVDQGQVHFQVIKSYELFKFIVYTPTLIDYIIYISITTLCKFSIMLISHCFPTLLHLVHNSTEKKNQILNCGVWDDLN